MPVGSSIRAYLGLRPRTFRDGIRLYTAYAVSILLRTLARSRFGSVGFWVRGNTNLGISLDGVRFDVRPRTNDLDLLSSKHEPLATRSFQVAPGDVVVDVGAHIGRYALKAATKASTVIAVEPDPSNFRLLERNVRLNGFSNVDLVPQALSSGLGTRVLWLATKGNTGTSTVDPDAFGARGGIAPAKSVHVDTLTLDDLVESVGLTRIDWLKVDVEGHEISVLEGAKAALRITRAMILEVNESTKGACQQIVGSAGFDLCLVEEGRPSTNWVLRKRKDAPSVAPKPVKDAGTAKEACVSIAICAYNEARRLPGLFRSIATQDLPPQFVLDEILVVASGCTDGTERVVEEWTKVEPRVVLIREPERRGKSSALNLILARFRGDILVLVNADACLLPGALSELLVAFESRPGVDVACGFPMPERSGSVVTLVEDVWWRLHNRTLQTLAGLGAGNHCCDELMALRRGFADSIPTGVVNDGAYFGVLAARRGVTVQFAPGAKVLVAIPENLLGLLRQRRRILRGHRQVFEMLGASPFTLQGLARTQPTLAAQILAAELIGHPGQTLAFLILALPLEGIAQASAVLARVRHRDFPAAWPMVD